MIKATREKLGWSQSELARRSGVKQGSISDIESGKTRHPRIDTVIKLARAMKVPVEKLMRG